MPTNGDVIVEAVITDDKSGVVEMKWAQGQRDAAYFTGTGGAGTAEGEVIPGSPGSITVTENGWISVYARDLAGNATVEQLQISNIDREAPVITLQGEAVVKVTIGTAYTEPGYAAQDNIDGDVTVDVVVTGTVDSSRLGEYMLIYDVTDSAGNAAVQVTRTVRVVDEVSPTITLSASPTVLTNGDVTVEAVMADNESGIVEMKWAQGERDAVYFASEGTVIASSPGSITVTENGWISVYARDLAGNMTVEKLQISNIDREAPVITLQGEAVVKLMIGTAYTEPGYAAQDNMDGDVTVDVVVTGTVDSSRLGEYMLIYDVTDSAGNAAVQVTRTVRVVDEVSPTITLSASPTVLTNGNVTVEAVMADNESGVVEMKWSQGQRDAAYFTGTGGAGTAEGEVIPGSPGSITVTENGWISVYARDLTGNATVEQLQISNIDREAPVITLQGEAVVKVMIGTAYTEPGYAAQDNMDGDVTADVVVTGTVDSSQLGEYMLIYEVTDSAGNAAVQVTRTVRVVDEVSPTITLSASPTVLTNGDVTVEAVMADNESGIVEMKWAQGERDTVYFASEGTVIASSPGSITVTENGWISVYARDLAGNMTVEQLQISNIDREAPVITLQGEAVVKVTIGKSYTEPGFTARDDRDGDISGNVVITGTVDSSRLGEYMLIYNVTDRAGNAAVQVTRTVRVVDEVSPTITLSASPTVLTNDDVTVEAVITDHESGVVEMKWAQGLRDVAYFTGAGGAGTAEGEVIPGSPGSITVTENGWISVYARDLAGNATVEQLQISNIDREAPVITLQGEAVVKVTIGKSYTEPGFTAQDDRDGDISGNVVITGTVDSSRLGEYMLIYDVTDSAGNAAVQVTRTIRVVAGPPIYIEDGGNMGSPDSEEPGASESTPLEPATPGQQPGTDEENEGQGLEAEGNYPDVEFMDTHDHWAHASIAQAVKEGIVSGYPDGTFKPNTPITRAEFTIMLIRALKLEGEGSAGRFTDESSIGQWAQSAIAIAVERDIISGLPDGSFRPNEPISRVQMAVMLAKVLGTAGNSHAVSIVFADGEAIPAWAADAVRTVADHEVMNGRSDNEFAPNEHATRAEAITVILRMLHALQLIET
ncbi:immunoglobulin-like domain-containing protein [Paenibacillus chungangensis]|uniref:Immunoglobulin-like domain-containing protein n=1 Tax=Paenibacillus chungangensis TaxID=696535 RepID=A0ABW3HNK5_9BACL